MANYSTRSEIIARSFAKHCMIQSEKAASDYKLNNCRLEVVFQDTKAIHNNLHTANLKNFEVCYLAHEVWLRQTKAKVMMVNGFRSLVAVKACQNRDKCCP